MSSHLYASKPFLLGRSAKRELADLREAYEAAKAVDLPGSYYRYRASAKLYAAEANQNMIGVLFNPWAWWLGVHYSPFNRRVCVTLIPMLTLWFTFRGGRAP